MVGRGLEAQVEEVFRRLFQLQLQLFVGQLP
jgi:hypothetical protein